MTNEIWGKPDIPPAEKNPGKVLTRFKGYIESDQTTNKGLLKLIVMVPKTEKYKATLATDRQGIMLYFEVFEPDEDKVMANMDLEILEMLGAEDGD